MAASQAKLVGRALDAGGVVEDRDVVGDDGVAGPLGQDAEGDENGQAVAVALGSEEFGVLCLRQVVLVSVLEHLVSQ